MYAVLTIPETHFYNGYNAHTFPIHTIDYSGAILEMSHTSHYRFSFTEIIIVDIRTIYQDAHNAVCAQMPGAIGLLSALDQYLKCRNIKAFLKTIPLSAYFSLGDEVICESANKEAYTRHKVLAINGSSAIVSEGTTSLIFLPKDGANGCLQLACEANDSYRQMYTYYRLPNPAVEAREKMTINKTENEFSQTKETA